MKDHGLRIDTLLNDAVSGRFSRRDLAKRAAALGLGAPMIASLLQASTVGSVSAQTEMTLSFDAAATGGGGGKPNTPPSSFSYVVNGGSQFEVNRMVCDPSTLCAPGSIAAFAATASPRPPAPPRRSAYGAR